MANGLTKRFYQKCGKRKFFKKSGKILREYNEKLTNHRKNIENL